MWAVAVIAVCALSCGLWFFVTTARSGMAAQERARVAAEAERAASVSRVASAQLAAFEPRRAEYERMATSARERNSAAQLAELAGLVRPFDPAYAARLQSEANLFLYADACTAQRAVSCVELSQAVAAAAQLPRAGVERMRSACGPSIASDIGLRTAWGMGLATMNEAALREVRVLAGCLETLTGQSGRPSVADIDATIQSNQGRWHLIGRPEPFQYTGGGGSGRGGGGRCRDSRGRFARCY